MRRSNMIRAAAAVVTATATMALAPAASAFELRGFGIGLNNPGTAANPTPDAPQLLAGAHPDVTFDLQFPIQEGSPDFVRVQDNVRSVDANLARGLIVNPTVVGACTNPELGDGSGSLCPTDSQVGVALVGLGDGFFQEFPLHKMETPPGVPAQFGFNVFGVPIKIDGGVRTGGDYGLSARSRNISQGVPLESVQIVLWGVPADPVHDAKRQAYQGGVPTIGGPAGAPARAFTSNPGRCTGQPLSFTATATGWRDGVSTGTASTTTQRTGGAPLTITGCESLPFEPSVTVKPTTTAPDSPSGLDVTVNVPQTNDPQARSSAHLKDLSLLLPEGMNVNPSAANGLTSCAPSQIALTSPGSPSCPDASSIGSVSIDTPLLDNPLQGRAYLAKQNDNPFGSTLAMYITAEGSGVVIKLAGKIDADPSTGRLRVTFADNPELPFNSLRVSLDGGPRAPLTTPASCGAKSVEGTATPWSGGASKPVGDSFSIACAPGLGGFAPGFAVGTQSPTAGLFSPLSVSLTRPDGQTALRNLTFDLPPGLLAKLRGVRQCTDAQANAGTCDSLSRVGSVNVTAGTGDKPFPLAGDVFLTGPYKGAPFGLVTRVRAVAGPLDLGTVVVRQALFIDSEDTQVRVASDPLPTILAGIPVRLRTLDVNVNRRDFSVNPTSCSPKAATGRVGSASGQQVAVSVRFQAGNCRALPLEPKLNLRLVGRGSALRDGGHPSLKAILTQRSPQSNLKAAEVKLPLSLALDPDNAQTLCEFAEGRKSNPVCPRGSIVGTAKARSPLLNRTLSGPVYFVKGQRTDRRTGRVIRTLPTLVVPLRGENGVQINLRARTSVSRNRLVTKFDPIPDASVSRFDLRLNGGSNGILVANTDVCSRSREVNIGIRGHNGALARTSPTLAASCR